MTELNQVNGSGSARPLRQNPVRSAVRFPMRLPLTIQTEIGVFRATTENVSANGLLFTCDHLPKLNSEIEFTITMPAAIMGSDNDVSIHCIGRIIRHEQDGAEKKAAVVIDEYFLRA
ncbi:PilZ domain-containing protein [Granulicella arctica]|uniref:PilZ domain-containing protein n=1 Tax=Granulicella arctica TaxID=940613 RepID=UPI0021E0B2A0|nr:PilZ domain-containing protein [Granulicella arctica]